MQVLNRVFIGQFVQVCNDATWWNPNTNYLLFERVQKYVLKVTFAIEAPIVIHTGSAVARRGSFVDRSQIQTA